MPEWLQVVLPIATSFAGLILGGRLTLAADAKRWRRDWLSTEIQRRRDYYAALIEQMHEQIVISRLVRNTATGWTGPEEERLASGIAAWRRELARGGLFAAGDVQLAAGRFDRARGRTADAIHTVSGIIARRFAATREGQPIDPDTVAEALGPIDAGIADMDEAMRQAKTAINVDIGRMNAALAPHALTWWQRRIQGHGPSPVTITDPPQADGTEETPESTVTA